MGNEIPIECTGTLCGYGVAKGGVGCVSGDGSCISARLLTARISDFHDQALADATQGILSILGSIPPDPRNRKLSFLRTNMGVLLAWVDHPQTLATDAVTADDEDEAVAKALGVIGVGYDKQSAM